MAEIGKTVEDDLDLTVFTVTGDASAREIIEALEAFYAASPTRLVLWDLRQADLTGISSSDIRHVAEATARHVSVRPGGKTALVSSAKVSFGLGRMYEALVESQEESLLGRMPVRFNSFYELDEARRWLRE